MNGITQITGRAAPLDQANVDTDQIIPKQFLTAVTRKGFGKHLFHDWRYLDDAGTQSNPEFVLNQPQHQGASILLSRENFGCGSSREHAPWALGDYGFEVVIAESFADIFYGNCLNNQLLPVVLTSEQMDWLFAQVAQAADCPVQVDLETQSVTCGGKTFEFDIAEEHKYKLLNGLDDIGLTLQQAEQISAFENRQPSWLNG